MPPGGHLVERAPVLRRRPSARGPPGVGVEHDVVRTQGGQLIEVAQDLGQGADARAAPILVEAGVGQFEVDPGAERRNEAPGGLGGGPFGSVEQARRWYESDSYQKAAPVRQAAADCNVVLLSGFVPPRGEPR